MQAILIIGVLCVLVAIALTDVRTGGIPDVLNILLLILGALTAFLRDSVDPLALILGVGFLGAQWLLSSGRWIGSGDVLLMASLSLVLPSWQYLVLALALAYVSGACVAMLLLALNHMHLSSRIPFGPFLALGGGVAMLWGENVIRWLVSL